MKRVNGPYAAAAAGVVVALVVLFFAYQSLSASGQQELILESAKAAIQVFPLAFFGVVIAELVRRRDERRDLEQKRDDFRRSFLKDLVIGYNRMKAIRRSLRGAGFGPNAKGSLTEEQLNLLDQHLAELSETQLDFERLKDEVPTRGEVFSNPRHVSEALRGLEQYARHVVSDWEDGRSAVTPGTDMRSLAAWRRFNAFLGGSGGDGGIGGASSQKQAIEDSIWPDLLGTNAQRSAQSHRSRDYPRRY